jgi:hypothetical protein
MSTTDADPAPGGEFLQDWDDPRYYEDDPRDDGAPGEPPPPEIEPAPPKMGLLEWVEEVFAPMIQRRVDLGRGQTWCARWWAHPEVAVRFDALRLAWYELSAPSEPGGDPGASYSSWFVNHVDPTLHTLLNGDTGPMSGCRPDRHSDSPVPSLRTERPHGRSDEQ